MEELPLLSKKAIPHEWNSFGTKIIMLVAETAFQAGRQ